jgi:hypothetical protein
MSAAGIPMVRGSLWVPPAPGTMTDAPDPHYCEPFEQMVRAGLLPGFIEIYIERDLKLKLSRI